MTPTDTTKPLRPLFSGQDFTRADAATIGALNTLRKTDRTTADVLRALAENAVALADQSAEMAASCDKGFPPGNNAATTLGMRRRELAEALRTRAELATPQHPTGVLEKAIGDAVRACPGLRFGYIGNLERWGDDRSLRIWVETPNGGTGAELWQAAPADLTFSDVCKVRQLVRAFTAAREQAKAFIAAGVAL